MNRSDPLTVTRLEDRCVPAGNPTSAHAQFHIAALEVQIEADLASPVPIGNTHLYNLVIDAFLIDPAAPGTPTKPLTFDFTLPIPDSFWSTLPTPPPTSPTPPPVVNPA
jgi:hypothetical protein